MKIIKPSFEIMFMNDPDTIMENLERAGRTCYKSENKIKAEWVKVGEHLQKFVTGEVHPIPVLDEKNTSAEPFIRSIIKSGHHSVLEHESISVRFVCDRGVMFELRTHRLASFSAESTRYANYAHDKFGNGITVVEPFFWHRGTQEYETWRYVMLSAEKAYLILIEMGARPEQARSVLPNSLKTEIVMTANIREWRHVFALRCAKAAHPQMRELLMPLLEHLAGVLPVLFGDVLEGLKRNQP